MNIFWNSLATGWLSLYQILQFRTSTLCPITEIPLNHFIVHTSIYAMRFNIITEYIPEYRAQHLILDISQIIEPHPNHSTQSQIIWHIIHPKTWLQCEYMFGIISSVIPKRIITTFRNPTKRHTFMVCIHFYSIFCPLESWFWHFWTGLLPTEPKPLPTGRSGFIGDLEGICKCVGLINSLELARETVNLKHVQILRIVKYLNKAFTTLYPNSPNSNPIATPRHSIHPLIPFPLRSINQPPQNNHPLPNHRPPHRIQLLNHTPQQPRRPNLARYIPDFIFPIPIRLLEFRFSIAEFR